MTGNRTPSYDYLIKLIIIGDTSVGKTCLLLRFAEDGYTPTHISTIGIDFKIKTMNIDSKVVKLQIWDTAGSERFRTITQTYYRGAMGIILAYDSSVEESFNDLKNWIKQIEQHAASDVTKILVANKCDKSKAVDPERGRALAEQHGMQFFQTSAKTGENVKEAFTYIGREIKNKGIGGVTSGSVQGTSHVVMGLGTTKGTQQSNKRCC